METEEEERKSPGHLFRQLMSSINPFSSYVLNECQQGSSTDEQKTWTLEESIFQNPAPPQAGQTQEDRLKKTSSEMFVIYKYVSDPLLKVRHSDEKDFQQIKDFFPGHNLLQTSPLNVQLGQMQMLPPQQQFAYMQQAMRQ